MPSNATCSLRSCKLLQLYKLNQDAVLAGVEAGSEAERQAVDGLVIGAVALKIVT